MAVEHKKVLVGLVWHPLEKWDGEHDMLSAVFASPNWHEKQKNHLMGLFLPPPPDWVAENQAVALWDPSEVHDVIDQGREDSPTRYILTPDTPIIIKSQIIVDGNASVLDAIAHWKEAYGTSEPIALPRSDEEEQRLSRHALMDTVWDAEKR